MRTRTAVCRRTREPGSRSDSLRRTAHCSTISGATSGGRRTIERESDAPPGPVVAGSPPALADRTDAGGSVSRSTASVARGGLLNLVGTVLGAACSFVLVVIVTRGLGASTTGIFFESVALFNILGTLSTWGSEVGVVRMIPMYQTLGREADVRHAVRAALIPVAVAGTALAVVMAVFAAPLGSLLTNGRHGAELAPVVKILAPFLPIYAVYTVALALTRGFGSMVPSNVIDKLGRSVAQPAFVLVVVAAGLSSSAIALAWAAPYGLALGVALLWVGVLMNRSQRQPVEARKQAALQVWREFWRFASARGLAGVFSVIILWLDTLLIGALKSPAAAGVRGRHAVPDVRPADRDRGDAGRRTEAQ